MIRFFVLFFGGIALLFWLDLREYRAAEAACLASAHEGETAAFDWPQGCVITEGTPRIPAD